MSTPGNEFREAEYLGLGFLAVSSSALLDRILDGQNIDADEKYTLSRAETFLKDVSSGARLVTSGSVNANVSSVDTVRKLAYSMEPLKEMQNKIQSAEIESTFENMANAIDKVLNNSVELDQVNLIVAKNFFRQLHVYLVSSIEAGQRRTGVNFGSNSNLLSRA